MDSLGEELQAEVEAIQSFLIEGEGEEVKVEQHPGGDISLKITVRIQGLESPLILRGLGGSDEADLPVHHLPPFYMSVWVSPDYPARPPRFEVSCAWLSLRSLSKACQELDRVLEEQGEGNITIISWVAWIQSESGVALSIKSPFLVSPLDGLGEPLLLDDRAHNLADSAAEVMRLVKESDGLDAERAFNSGLHSCGICFDEVPGMRALRLKACGHLFCKGCIRELCSVQIKEGTVHLVKCPEVGCGEPMSAADIRPLVEASEWERFETVSLGRVLDEMGDVVWCPRCRQPTVGEGEDSSFARCPGCLYCWCTLCQGPWHPENSCAISFSEQSLNSLREALSKVENPRNRQEEQRKAKIQSMIDQALSEKSIKETSKQCPTCRSAIQKNGGCNKMTCGKCGRFFCWLCGKTIKGYEHYSAGSCRDQLFPREILEAGPEAWGEEVWAELGGQREEEEVAGGGGVRGVMCPRCGEMVVKEDGDSNYMMCHCGHEFCFLCLRECVTDPQVGGAQGVQEHFRVEAGKCREHTSPEDELAGRTTWEN